MMHTCATRLVKKTLWQAKFAFWRELGATPSELRLLSFVDRSDKSHNYAQDESP
jgi:hypothetical protein